MPPSPDERLDQLVDHVVRLASGDLSARMEPSTAGDGIDAVIVGCNMMAEEMQALNADLEVRVAERTRELETARSELERLALYDALTGLANRALLTDRIRLAQTRTGRGALPPVVLLLDLDGFKAVNDSFGHPVGDQLLVEVARRLLAVTRAGDTVSRLGGDEFALLITDVTGEEAWAIAQRVVRVLTDPVRVGPHTCWIGASVGVRPALADETPDTLLRDADTAMYAAKSQARGTVAVFDPAMHTAALDRLELVQDLRGALAGHGLVVLYQPIVELTTGGLHGVEALLRWRHPTRGPLPPSEFITVAEDSGLITALDRWVLDAGLAQLVRWRRDWAAATRIGMHVNVSPLDLRSPRFAEDVIDRLAHHGVCGLDLTLEVTETQMLGEDSETRHALGVLRKAGIELAIDDFGAGYSSLGYFRRLSADVVKIDKSLITGLDADPAQSRVAAAILGVVDAFGASAIAEGVETPEQATRLRALGFRFGQGYHLGRPMDASAIATLLADAGGPARR